MSVEGCVAALASACCFGSFAVPIKSKAVLQAKVDPIIFQCYKSTAALLTSFVTLIFVDVTFTPWGLLGAGMWVLTGCIAIVAITRAGMGISQAVWTGLSSIVAFLWGVIVFHETVRHMPLSVTGLLIMTAGVTGIGIAAAPSRAPAPCEDDKGGQISNKAPETLQAAAPAEANGSAPADADGEHVSMLQGPSRDTALELHQAPPSKLSTNFGPFSLGLACAILTGFLAGSFLVPFKYATDVKGLQYILSFGIGAVVASFLSICAYFPVLRLSGRPLPSFHVKVAAAPALLAGTLWSTANIFSVIAVDKLGLSIGYPLIQCQLIISNLWAIFYYHELRTTMAGVQFFVSTLVLLLGGWLLAWYGT